MVLEGMDLFLIRRTQDLRNLSNPWLNLWTPSKRTVYFRDWILAEYPCTITDSWLSDVAFYWVKLCIYKNLIFIAL